MAIKVVLVAGARPNFMKIAPIMAAMAGDARLSPYLVHTGQHYDQRMSKLFFEELEIPKPDIDLGVGSGSHAQQTAETIKRFEPVCLAQRPAWVVVVGDVNSTIACALVATKLGIRVAHVEAGLRSFDRTMPEEINRVLTDRISDLLFTTEPSANTNLAAEGVDPARIRFVGNVMIDTLLAHRQRAASSTLLDRLALASSAGTRPYGVVTLHRPANVDTEPCLGGILAVLAELAESLPLIFPVHPRTAKQIDRFGLRRLFAADGVAPGAAGRGLFAIEPQGYLDFLHLMANSRLVLTDSGGLQEETTVLGVACVTLRDNTERPVTCTQGTNVLATTDPVRILAAARAALADPPTGRTPELWDGHAAERIVAALATA
ncbi:MAG: UDP-N-acetylglucosamine 2-epimerase (non-hydrolyzing) [Nitrospirae bacterium CG18_big_fil_WC_8_21_14_2_50_70_55]|nr:UDP-N-acetylglucosamine 2-epimerase (non-hydrolyzing) [Deltaproteobacteria bacterium]OIP66186.1 MAG: UDP-N-acetylglucosamine 2-epimerase [Nitrospirae bacterium CG2_30_70_394]PIQ06825.1 MAG: UDP-N-acetylglucosamine 2-epimerase (non-hydrolyzing) [Nitrospirae bacterium CG18_big_fil_WC_8_21_14_2_50_70_55]PIU77638.1 MAG: UDP-N-acetylglucosamine 2-epimerase (non-hydrolyzing) [Nitrospirae bacterium CG06_land_8_20_14_3_00_70_43]PIW81969.1 MAG: UDP-N-acetylglucosamine 2-epimerase (non-hydrolyzing) [N